MGSMRRPKRVVIHGSDERDYYFLVKAGEDLRQDQRIEQMFWAMNTIFQMETPCVQRRLGSLSLSHSLSVYVSMYV